MDEKGETGHDFKIGDVVICGKLPYDHYEWYERLVEGDEYEILDIDFHFPGKICVKFNTEFYSNSGFVPEEFFNTKQALRNQKLKQILKK